MSTFESINLVIERLEQKPHTVEQLSQITGKDRRTIFRYLKRIDEKGMQLEKAQEGMLVRYHIPVIEKETLGKNTIKKLKNISDELADAGHHKYQRFLHELLEKIEGGNPEKKKRHLITSDPLCLVSHGPLSEHKNHRGNVQRVLKAIEEGKKIRIQYQRSKEGEASSYLLSPACISLRVGRLYLLAQEEEREELRVFSFARIKMISLSSKSFPKIKVPDENFYKYSFGQWLPLQEDKVKAQKIRLQLPEWWVERLLSEANFNPPARFIAKKKVPEVELELYITPDLERWLFSLHPDVKVLKPLSLQETMKSMAQQTLKMYK
jgi:predicted DNA-binding transcriptional regulator YafY